MYVACFCHGNWLRIPRLYGKHFQCIFDIVITGEGVLLYLPIIMKPATICVFSVTLYENKNKWLKQTKSNDNHIILSSDLLLSVDFSTYKFKCKVTLEH